MAQHKWHKEIKAWADGAEIEGRYKDRNGYSEWKALNVTYWEDSQWEYRIKPQPKEEPYWLCCGCKDPKHNKSCLEAKMGHPERCKFGTVSEHFKPQPKEPQYLYVWQPYDEDSEIMLDSNEPEGILDDGVYRLVGKIKLEMV